MELFKVICVTCQAKLSVRNESLIGQIVGCPRCGSMVEVASPPNGSTPVSVSSESTINLSANLSAQPAPPAQAPTTEAPTTTNAEATSSVAAEEADISEANLAALEAGTAVAKYKMVVWSLASFFVGAALVGVVLVRRSDSTVEITAIAPSHDEIVEEKLLGDKTPAPTNPPMQVETPPEPPKPEPVEPKPVEIEEPTTEPEVTMPSAAVEENITANSKTVSPEPPTLETPAKPEPKKAPTITVEPALKVARRFDPLDLDPESLSLALIDPPSASIEPLESESPAVPVELVEEVPSTVPIVRRGPGREDASGRDAEKQLDLLIPAVKFDQLPLADCLRLFSQLSGVPVSVAPEQLLMAGITPQQKVTFEAKEAGLNFIFNQVLEPLHLEYATHGEQVVVTRQEATKRRKINYPIDDLLGSETNTEQLASWVEQLVAPTTWKSVGGEGTLETTPEKLRIEQTQQVQYQVLIFLERLRLAKKLPPRSRYPVERLAGRPANALLQEKLATPTTFTFSHYTPIDDLFVHWQTEMGVPLLIDWPALAEAEIWPATTIACAIIDQPWNTALEKVLEPLGLGWRAAPGGAIEITSAEKVQNELQLELYPLRRDFEGDVQQLGVVAKQQATGVILYDPVGKVFLVLESAAVQRVIFRRLGERGMLGE